jgi:hypothetical protein
VLLSLWDTLGDGMYTRQQQVLRVRGHGSGVRGPSYAGMELSMLWQPAVLYIQACCGATGMLSQCHWLEAVCMHVVFCSIRQAGMWLG